MKIQELYRSVTEGIIRDLENGAPVWLKPWKTGNTGGIMPVNAVTGRSYHGINVPILWGAASERGYQRHAWLTFKQAADKGANVRKGEKGTHVVFTKPYKVTDKETDEEKTIKMLKVYCVWNVAQIDGLPDPAQPQEVPPEARAEAVDSFIEATNATIEHGGDRACYVPSRDFINLPPFASFKGPEHYYATLCHETIHWSGAKHRLDRDLNNRFGTRAYAAEELVAELGAAFLCAHLGITGELRHAGYIQSWLELLREDDRAIFTASSKASQAADYLRSFSEAIED